MEFVGKGIPLNPRFNGYFPTIWWSFLGDTPFSNTQKSIVSLVKYIKYIPHHHLFPTKSDSQATIRSPVFPVKSPTLMLEPHETIPISDGLCPPFSACVHTILVPQKSSQVAGHLLQEPQSGIHLSGGLGRHWPQARLKRLGAVFFFGFTSQKHGIS